MTLVEFKRHNETKVYLSTLHVVSIFKEHNKTHILTSAGVMYDVLDTPEQAAARLELHYDRSQS